jgi:predicted DNA-binding antitoxin AbrB/MazE fold protein
MSQRLKAIYHEGAFVPQRPYDLPEGSEVELIVEGPSVLPPEVRDPEERKRILSAVVESMRQNPFPADSPSFTRDEMHERR